VTSEGSAPPPAALAAAMAASAGSGVAQGDAAEPLPETSLPAGDT
jgi:hypothetical protein